MNQFRLIPSILLTGLFCQLVVAIAAADVVPIADSKNGRINGTVYRVTVTPAQPPIPVFKYRLSVPPHQTIPGNSITHYLRSLGENSLNSPWNSAQEKFGMEVYDWYSLETKSADIPLEKLKTASAMFDVYVDNHLRRATMCRDCDWGLAVEDLRGRETINFLLPSVQQTRSMARALLLRNRLAVIEGRFDDSVDQLRMMYQLGQNVNELRFLVANLVGAAEIGMANRGTLNLISAKNAPNMYWALAELPQPIISIRESIRLESSFSIRYFPAFEDIETAEYSAARWNELLNELIESIDYVSKMHSGSRRQKQFSLDSDMLVAVAGLSGYSSAKQRLVESGMNEARVQSMPVAQVLLIDAARDCQILSDEVEKQYYVPMAKARQLETQLRGQLRAPTRLGAMIVDALSPALVQVRQAEIRVQAEINCLMAIESIRNHIATTGELPNRLDELKLPVRNNPWTGDPFNFERDGDMVVIDVRAGEGDSFGSRYEISIAPR